MNADVLTERLFDVLVSGEREIARMTLEQAEQAGLETSRLLGEVFWPTYQTLEKLNRSDQITRMSYGSATRLLRVLVDQVAARTERRPSIGRRVLAVCGPTDPDELGAQIAVDMLDREGFDVRFAGGSIPMDEILETVQRDQPDVLLLFASAPCDLPEIRQMIDTLNEIGAARQTQIVVGGGVFNRAQGLAEEIGADLWANDPEELVEEMIDQPEQRMDPAQRTVGKGRQSGRLAA